MVITLPWPPSSNTYWRRNGSRYFISTKGQKYREMVVRACLECERFDTEDRLCVSIIAHPPDKRRRDLDNLFKSILDSLQAAKVFPDDSQIDYLSIRRSDSRFGMIEVTVEKL